MRERTSSRFRVMNPATGTYAFSHQIPRSPGLATAHVGVDHASPATRHKDAMVAVARPALRFAKADARRLTEESSTRWSSRGG